MAFENLTYQYRRLRYRELPLPPIDVAAGHTLPGWVVRVAAAAAVGASVGLAGGLTSLAVVAEVVIVAAFVVWALVHPNYATAFAAFAMDAVFLLASPRAPFNPGAVWVIGVGYLALRLLMAAGLVSWKAKVAPGCLLGWRDAVVLGLTALIGLAALLPGVGVWAVVIGLVMVVVLAVVLARPGSTH